MHIHTTGMALPGCRDGRAIRRHRPRGNSALNAQIAQRKPRSAQGRQQLVAVVLQRLQPGTRISPHGQAPALQPQRAAMLRQLRAGDARPRLPERCQMATAAPALLQGHQAITQRFSRGRWRRQQQRHGASHRDQASLAARP